MAEAGEMGMFEELASPGRKRWSRSMLASLAAHLAVLAILLYKPAAVFVSPSSVDLGTPNSSGSVSIVYLAPVGAEQKASADDDKKLTLQAAAVPKPKPHPAKAKPEEPAPAVDDKALEEAARGGSRFGERVPGSPLNGDEVVPGFPIVFPDPDVRSDLPPGVTGDVIVQVTIDADGKVTDTKLIHGIGYGIEQKVLDTVQHWRFHPATRNGVTIASQHLVYFHYPS